MNCSDCPFSDSLWKVAKLLVERFVKVLRVEIFEKYQYEEKMFDDIEHYSFVGKDHTKFGRLETDDYWSLEPGLS